MISYIHVRNITLIISFTALALVLSIIPAFPMIGFSGTITLGALSGVLIALYLKPRIGSLTLLLVILLTPLVNPGILAILGPQTYYMPILYAWILAVLYYWFKPIYALIVHLSMITGFIISQNLLVVNYYPEYLVYNTVIPPLYLLMHYILKNRIDEDKLKITGSIIYGVIGDHLGGSTAASIFYLHIMGLYQKILHNTQELNGWITMWKTASYIYPIERTVLIIIAILLFLPSINAWRKYYSRISKLVNDSHKS